VWDVEGVPRHVRDETVAPARARVGATCTPVGSAPVVAALPVAIAASTEAP
jgi:hypothetical protein